MALEPMGVPTGDEGPNPELTDFKRSLSVFYYFSNAYNNRIMDFLYEIVTIFRLFWRFYFALFLDE